MCTSFIEKVKLFKNHFKGYVRTLARMPAISRRGAHKSTISHRGVRYSTQECARIRVHILYQNVVDFQILSQMKCARSRVHVHYFTHHAHKSAVSRRGVRFSTQGAYESACTFSIKKCRFSNTISNEICAQSRAYPIFYAGVRTNPQFHAGASAILRRVRMNPHAHLYKKM